MSGCPTAVARFSQNLGGDDIANRFLVKIPELLADFAAGDETIGMAHEISQQLKLLDRQANGFERWGDR